MRFLAPPHQWFLKLTPLKPELWVYWQLTGAHTQQARAPEGPVQGLLNAAAASTGAGTRKGRCGDC
jgi:hypothetical protein